MEETTITNNKNQPIQTPPFDPITPKPNNIYKYLLFISLIIFFGVIISFYVTERNKSSQLSNYSIITPTPNPVSNNSKTNNALGSDTLETLKPFEETNYNYSNIVDTNKTPPEPIGIKIYDQDFSYPNVVRWKNYLFGINQEPYHDNTNSEIPTTNHTPNYLVKSVIVYNIDTKESYDIFFEKPFLNLSGNIISKALENKYYFGFGRGIKFGPEFEYKIDLPPQKNSKIIKFKEPIGNYLNKIGEIYLSGFCYEGCNYYLYNSDLSINTTRLNRFNEADSLPVENDLRKEKFIGIDSHGRMILNIRNIPGPEDQQTTVNVGFYETKTIAAVPLINEQTAIPLLKESQLPETIYEYFMIDGIDKILMFGKSNIFMYNIKENKLSNITVKDYSKLLSLNNKLIPFFTRITKTNKIICFEINKYKYAINFDTELYSEDVPIDCYTSDNTREILIKELNLPKNLVVSPI